MKGQSHGEDKSHERRAAGIDRARGDGLAGVTTGDTGRGGLQFRYGRVELGHLHGGSFADLPFPKKVRDELIATGQAAVHPPLPDSGWVRRPIDGPVDAEAVIALLRLNYDRARARDEQRTARQG